MRFTDAVKAYGIARANGWEQGRAIKTAGFVFSAGGFSGLGGYSTAGNYWPTTFRKLTDSWPERSGFDPRSVNVQQFWQNSTVQACLAFIQRTFPEARVMVVEGAGDKAKPIDDHPLTHLVNAPNGEYSPDRMWQVTLADWWIWGRGNAYWQMIRDAAGRPRELWPVAATEVEPWWPKDGSVFIGRYDRTTNGATVPIATEDVVHYRFSQDPQNNRKGWSPLYGGPAEVMTLNEGGAYRGSLMQNHAVPSYALTPKDEQVAQAMDPKKAEALETLFQSKFTGRGRGRLFIPNFSANLERVGFSPQELDIREMLEWDADMICALFGLNSMVLGLPSGEKHRTFANMAEARESAIESNIVPTQALFAADMERQLLPQFYPNRKAPPNVHVAWDYSQVRALQDDQDKLWARIDLAVKTGWISPDEGRARVGMDPMPNGAGAKPLAPQAAPVPNPLQPDLGLNGANGTNGAKKSLAAASGWQRPW